MKRYGAHVRVGVSDVCGFAIRVSERGKRVMGNVGGCNFPRECLEDGGLLVSSKGVIFEGCELQEEPCDFDDL